MKIANDYIFTCSMFNQNLDAFVDNELEENIKVHFLAHAATCEHCNLQLIESKRLKKVLANLTPVAVTPEFDYRLKARIRLETTSLNNPLYRFKLFIHENMKEFLFVSALAFLILGVVFSRMDIILKQNNQPTITENKISTANSDIVSALGDYPEEIHYVLETVKPGEVETGVFLNEQDMSVPLTPNTSNFTLTCF